MNRSPDQQRAFDDWRSRALQTDILAEAASRGAKLKRAGREWHGPCPACGGRDRFAVVPARRFFNCRSFGGGDVIKMVEHLDGVSFLGAVEALTGEPPPYGHSAPQSDFDRSRLSDTRQTLERTVNKRRAEQAAYEADTLAAAARVWGESSALAGSLGEKYLFGFGLPLPPGGWPECLRFHPAAPYHRARLPALVARVDDVAGDITGIWREYISADGTKAKIEDQKLGLGPVAGGAVRLGGVASRIGAAEGVRTALGAWALIRFAYPVWSCLSTSGLLGFEVPLGINRIVIYPDSDNPFKRNGDEFVPAVPAGRKAATDMRGRLAARGIACTVAPEPSVGRDYLNVWQSHAREVA